MATEAERSAAWCCHCSDASLGRSVWLVDPHTIGASNLRRDFVEYDVSNSQT